MNRFLSQTLLVASVMLSACAGSHTASEAVAKAEFDPRSEWAETSPHTFLRYQQIGEGASVVVLIHELGAALENWDEVTRALATSKRTVVRYDMRGAGLSSKIRGPITMEDHANDLRGLLDTLHISGPVTLIGDTIGASVALQFASQYPERAAGVLAMGPTAYLDPQPQLIAKFPDPLAPGAGPATMTGKPYDPNDPDAAHSNRVQEFKVVYPEALRTDQARLARFYGVAYSTDPTSAMLTLRMVYGTGFREAFSRIRCPVLMTRGVMFPRPASEYKKMVDAIPNAEFVEIQSAHYPAVESPELVAELAQQFLTKLGR